MNDEVKTQEQQSTDNVDLENFETDKHNELLDAALPEGE
jgi:hypothetical protein